MILIYSDISLRGPDLDPDAVTSALGGLQPTETARRGTLKPSGHPREQGRWWLATLDMLRSTTADSLDDLFARLDPAWPALVDLSKKYKVDIECCLRIYDGPPHASPHYAFDRRHVRQAGELGASLSVDDYDFQGTGAGLDETAAHRVTLADTD